MVKNIIFVQARMDSKRLPGKMNIKIGKFTILEWVLRRLLNSKKADKIILLTSKNDENIIFHTLAKKLCIKLYKGDEENVLKRFYNASLKFKSKNIIRVCADNPFVDPNEIDRLINNFDHQKFDYAYNNLSKGLVDHPDGFGGEIFTVSTLKSLYKNAKSKFHQEHVTSYLWSHKSKYKIQLIEPNQDIKFPELKFDIDELNDLQKFDHLVNNYNIKILTKARKIIELNLEDEIQNTLEELFPICRSITGLGNRKTLNVIKKIIPLKIKSIISGSKVFDWTVPREWNIKDAYISDKNGNRIVDFRESNLHVMSYSIPIKKKMKWKELKQNIYYLKNYPSAIPYRTSYYKNDWAFCVTKKQWEKLNKISDDLSVCINSKFSKGKLNYGEILIPGTSNKEILISCYICHPSMANDSLSGVVLTTYLARHIMNLVNRKWSYRIIFVPETIGAIAYSHKNKNKLKKINFGLNITTVGGKGQIGFKKSYNHEHFLNRYIAEILNSNKISHKVYPFDIHGSDERQYSTQGFKINIASITKDKYYEYKQYHTSLDNLDFVNGKQILDSFLIYIKLIEKFESRSVYKSNIEYCEPMLSKYDLYPKEGGALNPTLSNKNHDELSLILWIIFLSDGKNSVDDISYKLGVSEKDLNILIEKLVKKKLIKNVL